MGMNRFQTLYRQAAQELAARVTRELSDEIHAVILYGSVARGEARSQSDIDVLLIARHGDHIRARVAALEEDVDAQHGYSTFLTSIYLTLAELKHLGAEGSRLIMDVLHEGIVLYDDGSFAHVREEILAAGRRNVGRRAVHARERPPHIGRGSC